MKVFISYTSKDREWAYWIGWHLQEAGHEPFVHEWEIQAGGNIPQWMEEKLAGADRLLGVFSDDYCAALYSQSERWAAYWHDADGRKGFLVPIEVRQVREWPIFVKPLKRLSLTGLSEEAAKLRLLEFLEPPRRPAGPPKFPGKAGPSSGRTDVRGGPPTAQFHTGPFMNDGEPLSANAPDFPSRLRDGNGDRRGIHVDLSSRDEVKRWISNKPHEVAIVFAARAALRVAPLLVHALKPGGGGAARRELGALEPRGVRAERASRDIVLPVFRAMATPWVAGQWSTHGAAAHAAAEAANTAAADAANTNTADTAAANAAAAEVAYAAATAAAYAGASAAAAYAGAYAAAATAAAYAGASAAADAAAAADADGHIIINDGASASALAALPLWLTGVPAWAREGWQELEHALLTEGPDWRVWTEWYRARLEGRNASKALEVARVLIAEEIWKEGPRAVNAEIARLIEQHKPPAPIPDVPSELGFTWTAAGTIAITSSPADWPVFPLPSSEKDHRDRLETCRTLAQDIVSDLRKRKYQVRGEYGDGLKKYVSRLPDGPGRGNILLADAEARTLRSLFAAEAEILSFGFAAQLKTFLEQHIGLRPYYPEIGKFYRDVQTGRIETPLPQDAVDGFISGVKLNSPGVFGSSVSEAIEESAQPPTIIAPSPPAASAPADPNQPMPPADPLKELDPKKAHDFAVGGIVNALWKTYLEGEKVPKAAEGWHKAGETLQPYVTPILEWLRNFMGS